MGLFESLRRKDSRFVIEKAYKLNSEKHVAGVPKILAVLIEHHVNETNQLQLEFFFYTNTIEKAKLLAAELKNRNYSVEYNTSAHDNKLFVINGRTIKMKIEEKTLVDWAKEMCGLGYNYDCEFDGWGTDIKQKDLP